MKALSWLYKKVKKQDPPYYFNYSIGTIITKPIRKWVTNVVAANCPFNCIRIFLYRMCGFKIGKGTFIGMRCYLDDMCYDMLRIGNNVTISYGVYFACHGKKQAHYPITIEDGVYIGMRASVISKNSSIMTEESTLGIVLGKSSIVGACTLVNCNVPEKATAVGIPCRIIEGKRTDE